MEIKWKETTHNKQYRKKIKEMQIKKLRFNKRYYKNNNHTNED